MAFLLKIGKKKVELTVEIAVLLGIAIAVRHLLKKRNRKIAGIVVLLFVAGVFHGRILESGRKAS